VTTATTSTEALRTLRTMAAALLPLPVLTPEDYALGHALFEARSDQRDTVIRWLTQLLETRAGSPTRVLSIGCGDGTVDVELARTLTRLGQPVRYDGIEPNPASGRLFLERLKQVAGVSASVGTSTLEEHAPAGRRYDVVLAVHSLYYVPDLPKALESARDLLAPGGVLVVLHAPHGALNQLVGVLAPSQGQQFSEAVAEALATQQASARCERLDATLNLAAGIADDDDRRVLDFAVQVTTPESLRPAIFDVLRTISLPGTGLRIPHPLDGFIVDAERQ
jgi:SAM-dependent methyltransferase